MSRFLTAHQHN